ncbi:MAG: 2-oxoglutarate dehydrogenase complex dihydrolipoyllysine-residue succinyltransferase [Bacteroidales bacterium]
MIIEVKVPSPGESITEVQLASWLVSEGEIVEKDQEIAEIDSDKATLSISAEEGGAISFKASEGDTIEVGSVIATIDTSKASEAPSKKPESKEKAEPVEAEAAKPEPAPEAAPQPAPKTAAEPAQQKTETPSAPVLNLSPLARKLMEAENLSEQELIEILKKSRIGKKDIEFALKNRSAVSEAEHAPALASWGGTRDTSRKKMSTLRLKLSQRLVSVKNETAMLTTFNEVNMTPIIELRKKYKEAFREKHGVSLGFMSFFTKAVTESLRIVPEINARIDGNEIVYHDYADIGIAVSSPKGLMVPVLRNAERMSLAEIELKIKELAQKARTNKITIDEMTGGTFTITNGGVFGSMLSTPIINPPQSAILGMHNIVERPIAVNGKVEIHPVMYVAMSYDHRIIDGRESVTFLVNVKKMLENPVKMLFAGQEPEEVLLQL